MRIPRVISKNNHEYIFEKQVNKKIFYIKICCTVIKNVLVNTT